MNDPSTSAMLVGAKPPNARSPPPSAADISALDSITHEMSCTICTSIFVDPRTLDCGHVFCLRCIYALTQTAAFRVSSGHLRCPMRCDTATMLLVDNSANDDGGEDTSALYRRRRRRRGGGEDNNDDDEEEILGGARQRIDEHILQVAHPEIAERGAAQRRGGGAGGGIFRVGGPVGGNNNKRRRNIDAAIMNLPRNHTVRNVCLALRRRQLQLSNAPSSSSADESSTAGSAVACDICAVECGQEQEEGDNTTISMCETCGAFLCAMCRNNTACDHAMLCSSASSSGSPTTTSGGVGVMSSSSSSFLVATRPAFFGETVALAWTLRQMHLKATRTIQQCHLDLLPFRCVTVRCSATVTAAAAALAGSNNNNSTTSTSSSTAYRPPRTVHSTYRVWIRRGLKPQIEPLVSFGDCPVPERALLHDLQVMIDTITKTLTALHATMADVRREAVLHPRINDDALVYFFYCRLVSYYCFYLRMLVLPFCQCFLTASAVVGCAWCADHKRGVPPVVPRPSSLYESYVLRFLARQEELANETSRMICAQVKSCFQKVQQLQDDAGEVAHAIVQRGRQAEETSSSASSSPGVSKREKANNQHPPIIDINHCWRQLADRIHWTSMLTRRLCENIEIELSVPKMHSTIFDVNPRLPLDLRFRSVMREIILDAEDGLPSVMASEPQAVVAGGDFSNSSKVWAAAESLEALGGNLW